MTKQTVLRASPLLLALPLLFSGCFIDADDDKGDPEECRTSCEDDGVSCKLDCDDDDNACRVDCDDDVASCTTDCD